LFGGTKDEPLPFNKKDKGYAYLEDNAALEFNVPSTDSITQFPAIIRRAMRNIETLLTDRQLSYTTDHMIELSSTYLKDERAHVLGCLPDKDAYMNNLEGGQRVPFNGTMLGNKRYCGGHIHLQYDHEKVPRNVAALFLDLYLGLPCARLDKQRPTGRRDIYGRPGLYREKPYGIEYRTLSNFWVFRTDTYLTYMAAACQSFAVDVRDNMDALVDAYKVLPWERIHDAIVSEDIDTAQTLIRQAAESSRLHLQNSLELACVA